MQDRADGALAGNIYAVETYYGTANERVRTKKINQSTSYTDCDVPFCFTRYVCTWKGHREYVLSYCKIICMVNTQAGNLPGSIMGSAAVTVRRGSYIASSVGR
jgi:hypothetical protein